MTRRWRALLLATAVTVAVAGGVGVAADRLAAPRAQPPPRLNTVSPAALGGLGITLSAAAQPPYCDLVQAAARRGWVNGASGGCAISRAAAEQLARLGGRPTVVESLLALVSMTSASALGRDHLTWLVVTRGRRGPGLPASQLILIDGSSAQFLAAIRLSPVATGAAQ